VFAVGNHFQASLICVRKAGAYQSGAPYGTLLYGQALGLYRECKACLKHDRNKRYGFLAPSSVSETKSLITLVQLVNGTNALEK
jgi:hypothetical protein